jgi:hypothetical protein
LKNFWKGFTVLDAIKNICDPWEEVKISTLTGVLKKLIPTLMNDLWWGGWGGSNSIACYREIFRERKSQLIRQTSLLSYLKGEGTATQQQFPRIVIRLI